MSAGVLTLLDTDYAVATALGIPCITEAPFSAISPGARSELERCIDAAHAVVVTAMPIGRGNIENIRTLAHRQDKPMILLNNGNTRSFQDFTGGEAEGIIRRLLDQGAVAAERIDQVMQILREAT